MTKFRHIQPLQSFLEKVAASMKVVASIVENDTMIHIKDLICFRQIVFLNLSFLPDTFFGTKNCPFLDIGTSQILGQVRTGRKTKALIKKFFKFRNRFEDCYKMMTGSAMILIGCIWRTHRRNGYYIPLQH